MNGESRGTACLPSQAILRMNGKWFRVDRRLIVYLYNCFPLRRGGFEQTIGDQANI